MAYLGKGPEQVLSGVASKSTFTGDGSTTTFDISTDIPAGGENDIQVFVDNVRQEPGSGASYTVGVDGSGNLRRITFNVAPEASQSIYVINPRRIEAFGEVLDNSIATAKLQNNAVTVAKLSSTLDLSSNTVTLPNDVVNADKIADDAISEEHLDVTAITGNTELSANAASDDVLLIYDSSNGTLKKINAGNVGLQQPTITSISPTNLLSGDGTGNYTIVITGTGFITGATAKLVTDGGTDISFDSVTRNSSTQLTCVIAKNTANLTNANEPFDVVVTTAGALSGTSADAITIDASPVFVTASGSLGSVDEEVAGTFYVNATDPESAGNVTFELQSGSLPPNFTLTNSAADGGTAVISGTTGDLANDTTYNFTLRAVDAASNVSSRSFSITVNHVTIGETFTSSGTFSVPSGITAVDVLVVAGGGAGTSQPVAPTVHAAGSGGAGAGGLIFMPEYPVQACGTITVTVGQGGGPLGATSPNICGQDSVFGSPGDPGFTPTSEVLTAKGGGRGGSAYNPGQTGTFNDGYNGGSGGGSNRPIGAANPCRNSTGIQPTQPGNSGAYGFGNPGGEGGHDTGGGGGGAGAAGTPTQNGGIGRAYTIADATTPVYYAGGGGGGIPGTGPGATTGQGGSGGGGQGYQSTLRNGEANKGGGAAGSTAMGQPISTGGKGIVIVRY